MRHPFDGLNLPEDGLTRRGALGAMAAAAASLVGLNAARAQQLEKIPAATLAFQEGGKVIQVQAQVTTRALGEEGGTGGTADAKVVTTEPFSEEAGKVVSRAQPGLEDGAMTRARNEDGGGAPGIGVTTLALGEEGAA